MSGLIKNPLDKNEIEFWGHDAGEFVKNETEDQPEATGNTEESKPGTSQDN